MTIEEYWNLIGWEPFFTVTWEADFSQVCSFRRMLMNHMNFHFTQISDKTNVVIFLKSPKTIIFGSFWPFLVNFARWGFFPIQKIWICHTKLYMDPPHHVKFQKKLITRFRQNLWTDRRTDGRTGRPLF